MTVIKDAGRRFDLAALPWGVRVRDYGDRIEVETDAKVSESELLEAIKAAPDPPPPPMTVEEKHENLVALLEANGLIDEKGKQRL